VSAVVGRGTEIGVLHDQLTRSGTRIVQLVGEAGIGKSTLAAAVATDARASGQLVCVSRCPDDDGAPPLWPWLQVLSTLVEHGALTDADLSPPVRELLDGTGYASGSTKDAEVARFRLFEAIGSALTAAASRRRCVVVLEDLHWADSSTARLVAHLASSWADAPNRRALLLVITRRPDGAAATRPGLATALDALARHDALRLDLDGLGLNEVADLARRRSTWDAARPHLRQPVHARGAVAPGRDGPEPRAGPRERLRRAATAAGGDARADPQDPGNRVRRGL
jgi:hypothetical protein